MSIASDPKYQPFIDVLGTRLFRIPDYQRAYSWTERQINDLFGDITKLYDKPETNKHSHHFMATIVCLNTSQKEELGSNVLPVLHVVDGQQRLTTLIILLKAIAKKMSLFEDHISREEVNSLNKLLVKDDDRLILLHTNHDSSNVFRSYLKGGTVPDKNNICTIAEKRLIDAFALCERYVDQWHETKEVIDLLKIIKNKLDFIFYEISDEQSVYTVFEVLNSRGLPVDSLDKCKSMLMGIVFEKLDTGVAKEEIKELHKLWSNIYREIGLVNIKGDEILRFTATLNHSSPISQPLSEEDSLAQFRRICESEPTKAVEVTQEILQVTKILTQLSNNKRLEAVTEISYARLLSVSILSNRFLEKGDKEDVIRAWEKVTFRVFGLCDKDSRFSRGDFTRLAYDVYNTKMTKDKIMERLIKIGSKYSIDDAVKNLRQSDCYNAIVKKKVIHPPGKF